MFPDALFYLFYLALYLYFFEFFRNRVLQMNAGIEHGLGSLNYELAGCLLLAWICVYLIIWKGLHSSGKVST